MKREGYLFESGGLLSLGETAERTFGRKNFLEIYSVFSSPQLYRVVTVAGRDLGSLEQDFVDRLVEQMSSFLLGGSAWTVERVHHNDRQVVVQPAPRGVKPSWGGFVPQHLGFDLCQSMKAILTGADRYPYLNEAAAAHLEGKREDLGDLLRRPGYAIQVDVSPPLRARWWTYAGGRINHILKYGLEVARGWKVVADNLQLRIEGDGLTHETFRAVIGQMATQSFWDTPEIRRAVLAKLPGYRLSKFQDCLPERFAVEVIERYLLDVEGAVGWLVEVTTA
jgi:ATP-dependent Lhr-like helicase